MLIYASISSSHVLTDPYGRNSNKLVVVSLGENGNNCSLITSGLTPFNLQCFPLSRIYPGAHFGSSL